MGMCWYRIWVDWVQTGFRDGVRKRSCPLMGMCWYRVWVSGVQTGLRDGVRKWSCPPYHDLYDSAMAELMSCTSWQVKFATPVIPTRAKMAEPAVRWGVGTSASVRASLKEFIVEVSIAAAGILDSSVLFCFPGWISFSAVNLLIITIAIITISTTTTIITIIVVVVVIITTMIVIVTTIIIIIMLSSLPSSWDKIWSTSQIIFSDALQRTNVNTVTSTRLATTVAARAGTATQAVDIGGTASKVGCCGETMHQKIG